MPVCIFDIADDGTATPADLNTPVPEGQYRWCHFDLSDPELAAFLHTHVP